MLGAVAGAWGLTAAGDISAPGTYHRKTEVKFNLARRSYRVHIPRGYDGSAPVPVVVVLHGAFSNAKTIERRSGFSELADQEGFVAVYPQGIGLLGLFRHWNSGHCCGKAHKADLDDVGYVLAVVDDLASSVRIDRTRLYVTGFSNGGMLAHRIAAEQSELIAAAAPVSATIGGQPDRDEPEWTIPSPRIPVPILMIHGRADENVPYEGGQGPKSTGSPIPLSVSRSVDFWVEQNGCEPEPSHASKRGGVLQETWTACRPGAEVSLYSLDGWDHRWPGPEFTDRPEVDEGLRGFDAAPILWEFFRRHRRPASTE